MGPSVCDRGSPIFSGPQKILAQVKIPLSCGTLGLCIGHRWVNRDLQFKKVDVLYYENTPKSAPLFTELLMNYQSMVCCQPVLDYYSDSSSHSE